VVARLTKGYTWYNGNSWEVLCLTFINFNCS